MGGVFLVLTVGVAASFFYTICELLWDVGCTSLRENVGAIVGARYDDANFTN